VGGVGIGIFTVFITVALASGIKNFLTCQIRTYGNTRVIQVYLKGGFSPERMFQSRMGGLGKTPKPLKKEDAQRFEIKFLNAEKLAGIRSLPGVTHVGPFAFCILNSIRLEGQEEKFDVVQIPFGSGESLDIVAGKFFSGNDAREVILSYSYIQAFGCSKPEELLEKEVVIAVARIPIAQVFLSMSQEKTQDFKAKIVGFVGEGLISTSAYFPERFAMDLGRFSFGIESLYTEKNYGFMARVAVGDESLVPEIKQKIEAKGFHAVSVLESLETLQNTFNTVSGLLSLFGIIALLVAALGIINTLMMSIHERKREIGIMKAMGAARNQITMVYSAEATAIGCLGSLLGVLIGMMLGFMGNLLAARLYPAYWKLYSLFQLDTLWTAPLLVLFGCVVGFCAGIYPAFQAASLDPIKALKND
jgi:putative ABC transport system permease protein